MQKIINIHIPDEVNNYLERLSYEIDSFSYVIANTIKFFKDEPDVIESDTFKKYNNLLVEAKAEYESVKRELTDKHVPDWAKKYKVSWNLDFNTAIMTITVDGIEEGCSECNG